ncbi:MAG: UvrD-helicase domain-containing protein [bacterium]
MSTEQKSVPDAQVRSLALTPTQSFIVQAPAGSGKTTLLASRYVALLTQVSRPEEILAITFTRKAAAEMRHRVLKLLSEDTPQAIAVRARERDLNWQIFTNPNVLKIQTIDSFALDVASQVPSLSQAAGLTIAERAQTVYAKAAIQLFNRLYHDDQTNPLVAHFLGFLDNDINKATRLLSFMLARRDQWLAPVRAVASAPDQSQTARLLAQAIHQIRASLAEQLDHEITASDEAMLQQLADAWGLQDTRDSLLPRLLTAKDELRKRLTVKEGITDADLKTSARNWLESLEQRGLGALIVAYTKLPGAFDPETRSTAQQKMLSDLHLCCVGVSLAVVELEQVFRDNAQIDFTGILLAAKAALRDEFGPTDLALYLDYQICHLLVDEYQDTSRAQYEFFSMLVEGWQRGDGKTFFAVGDPMQSIYRFRDADVSIFDDSIRLGVADIPLTHCQLRANFRSAPAVVRWCNDLFSSVFAQGKAATLGEVPFSAAVAMQPENPIVSVDPITSLIFPDDQAETQFLVTAVQDRLQYDPDGTIAVLCRARNHVVPLLKQLAAAGIPVLANDMDLLSRRGVVRDLMNLHQLLVKPADRLPWYAVLRSPLFGLTLEQFALLDVNLDIPAQLRSLSDAIPCLQRLLTSLDWAKPRLYEIPLRELLEGFWQRCGGVHAYREQEQQDARAWFELVDDLGMAAYDTSALESALEVLFAPSDQTAQVQVMTIHRSKGLEFDHVFLPYLHSRTRADDPQLLLWRAGAAGLLMGVNGDPVHDWLKFEEQARAGNEEKRMLYVACTRAVKSLVTTFVCEEGKNPAGLAKWIAPYATRFNPIGTPAADREQTNHASDMRIASRLRRLPAEYRWHVPKVENSAGDSSLQVSTVSDLPALSAAERISERYEVMLGLLIHRALQWLAQFHVPSLPPDSAVQLSADELTLRLRRWLAALKAPAEMHEGLLQESITQLMNTLHDTSGRWVLHPHQAARTEWLLSGVIDGELVQAVLDRSFILQDERWVIDYKTGAPKHAEGIDVFVRAEVARYRQQLRRYKSLLSELEPLPVRTALYFTALSHLEEIQVD